MAPVNCMKCLAVVKQSGYSIKCQRCLMWLHRDCANITVEELNEYARELKDPNGRRYVCNICEPRSPRQGLKQSTRKPSTTEESTNNEVLLQQIKEYLDQSLQSQLIKIKEENASLLKQYEDKIENLEKEVKKLNSLKDELLTVIDKKFESYKGKEPMELEEQENLIMEMLDRQNRMANVVIFNIKESQQNTRMDRNTELMNTVKGLLKDINIKWDNTKAFRLGKYDPNKIRPVKVTFSSVEEAKSVLKNKQNITVPSIRIYSDQTPAQRKYFLHIKQNLQEIIANGDDTKTIKYVNNKPTIVNKTYKHPKN